MISPFLASTSLLVLIDLGSIGLFGPDIHMPINLGGCAHELPSFLPNGQTYGSTQDQLHHEATSMALSEKCSIQHLAPDVRDAPDAMASLRPSWDQLSV